MLNFLIYVLLLATGSGFVYMLLGRLDVFTYLQVNGNRWVSEAARCRFCSVWWISVGVAILMSIFLWNPILLVCPVFSVMITLNIVKACFG